MNRFFDKSFYVKILSIFIAILLWFYVLNADNPYGTKHFIVPLRIENQNMLQENNLYLKNNSTLKRTIEVTARGRDEVLNTISANDFEAVLDFSKVKSVNDKYLTIDGPYYDAKDINLVLVSPQSINIELERIISNTFSVQLVVKGVPKTDYKLIRAEINQKSIQLKDRESLINQVDSVKAEIDVSEMSEDGNEVVECKVYDSQGMVISELSKGLTSSIKLYFAKEVPVSLIVEGTPASDFVETGRKVTPEKIMVTGTPAILSELTELKTLPVNINGATSSIATNIGFDLPEGIRLVDPSRQATVNITIEQLRENEMVFVRDIISLINTENAYSYTIIDENVVLKIKGREVDLSRLSSNTMSPSIDVSGLREGVSTIPIKVTLPPSIRLIEEVTVEVRVEKVSEVIE